MSTDAVFQRERVQVIWQDLQPLFRLHWEEIAAYRDIPLDPHERAYFAGAGLGLRALGIAPPELPKPPPPPKPEDPKADAAAERARRKALATQGRSSTILTGPKGLGDEPTGQRKQLLGQ